MPFDPEAFGIAMGEIVREAVEPLQARIAELERALADSDRERGLSERSVAALIDAAVKALPSPLGAADLRALVAEEVKALPAPKDGASVTLDDVRPLLDGAITQLRADADEAIAEPLRLAEAARDDLCKALGELRQPEDGQSVTIEDVQPVLDEAVARMQKDVSAAVERVLTECRLAGESVQRAVAGLRQPEDGKSVALADVQPMLAEAVKAMRDEAATAVDAAIKAIPAVSDGKSVTVEELAPMLRAEVERAVSALPAPKDGVGLAGAVIDREGVLNLTLTNGEVKSLGRIEGKDGSPGLGFDDLQVEYDGEKTITLKMQRGDVVKEASIVLPINIDRGIFCEGREYTAGDCATWGGSYWIAQRATKAKPDGHGSGWRLVAKRGRDGASAYQVAKAAGFLGTEREWLESIYAGKNPRPVVTINRD